MLIVITKEAPEGVSIKKYKKASTNDMIPY
jgi:hypothetical protein